MNRRAQRDLAFAIGFERGITGDPVASIVEGAQLAREIEAPAFCLTLAEGVAEHEEFLDQTISQHIRGWKLKRLSKVTHAILRLALYEMYYENGIPLSVSINEAVELAKKYGDRSDAPYVNGVLSSVAKVLSASASAETLPAEDTNGAIPPEESLQ